MTRRFQRPGRSIAAYAVIAFAIWVVPLWACGDLVGVGSLSGGDAASAAASDVDEAGLGGADAKRDEIGIDAVDAGVDGAADAVADDSDDGPDTSSCPGVQWAPWSDLADPKEGFFVGFEQTGSDPDAGYSYYVCRARDANDGGDIIPGMFVKSIGCFYTIDGVQQFQSTSYDVLMDPNVCLTWTPYDGGLARAVVGGQLGPDPLYVCSAPLSPQAPWWQAGYLKDASCRVPTSGGNPEDIAMDVTIATQ